MMAKLPPGPNRSFVFPLPQLRLLRFIVRPLQMLEMFASQYEDCFTLPQKNSPPTVYFYHPEAIKEIFTAPPEVFDSSDRNKLLQPLVGENSLLLLRGDRHQRQRKLLMPPFHGARMQTYGETIVKIARQVTNKWQVGQPFAVRAAMQEISLKVILCTVFGIDSGDRYLKLQQLLTSMLESIGSPASSTLLFFPLLQKDWGAKSPWGHFLRQKQEIDRILLNEIAQRRSEPETRGDDILSLLLAARDEAGQPMSDDELKDELITLLFAGHETTASAIAWAIYWIERSPDIRDKLLAELNTISVEEDPLAVSRLPYLTAICQETLRIYPIAVNTFPRRVTQPIEIFGYHFEPGTLLIPSIYLTHHRQEIYPEPKRFKPERFLERTFSAYEYLPFGGGSSLCIGYAFAQFEMKLVLATIFSRLELKLATDRPVKPTRRGLTLAPSSNLQMVVT
ncbi:cytochrome P450 [Myxosarcina sp. GI1]|uniref:cytochrome P450 n=1 Tax=Myxosarcina sp. GI1 TaxID=1541065 RepID=UPI00055E0D5D|nr:cytochrome P450 [Myxosarcina sp. GI1]